MPDLLIEIGCEELPAAACLEAERQLTELLTRSLFEAGLESRDARIHVGPRRLVAIASVPPQRDAVASQQRGPRADAPEAARSGFARKHGLAVDELEQREGFVWAVSSGRAAPAAELVAGRRAPHRGRPAVRKDDALAGRAVLAADPMAGGEARRPGGGDAAGRSRAAARCRAATARWERSG